MKQVDTSHRNLNFNLTGMNFKDCFKATGAYQQESLKYFNLHDNTLKYHVAFICPKMNMYLCFATYNDLKTPDGQSISLFRKTRKRQMHNNNK